MPGKILIADDSLKIQQQLTEILEAEDIEVVAVSNGEFAVRKLPEVRPDLVLADIFMPVRTGYEVCEFIKQSDDFSGVPVLLLSSTLEPYDEAEAERVGCDGKIEKPITDNAATLAAIMEHLDRALSGKPAKPVVDADEFAALVPEAEEKNPADLETVVIPPPEPAVEPVKFEETETPMGFADLETPSAEGEPAAGGDAPFADAMDSPGEKKEEDEPGAVAEPAALAEPAAPEASAGVDIQMESPEETPAVPESEPAAEEPPQVPRDVEKAELAAPWEMTAPPEGAPEIKEAGEWHGQDWEKPDGPILPPADRVGVSPEEIAAPEEAAEAEAPVETPAAPAETKAAPAPSAAEAFPPEEFAAAFTQAASETAAEGAAEPVSQPEPEPKTAPEPKIASAGAEPKAAPASANPPQINIEYMIEEVAKKVIEHLPPEVMERLSKELAKEIARPMAEKLVKEKLIE